MQESRTITRKSASNLALAFVLLPKAKRDAMSALYAFCREVDDVADNESVPAEKRREQLAAWREDVKLACELERRPPARREMNGGSLQQAGSETGAPPMPQFPVNRELQPVIRQFHLPFALFDELIQGCE